MLKLIITACMIMGWAILPTTANPGVDVNSDLTYAINKVKNSYIRDIPQSDIVTYAITGAVTALDNYSTYLSKPEFEKITTASDGQYVGVGIEVSAIEDSLIITDIISGSPAESAGLMVGDLIHKIDNVDTEELMVDVDKYLAGQLGTSLAITVLRGEPLKFVVTRGILTIPSVTVEVIDQHIALIKVKFFSKQTVEDLSRSWKSMSIRPQGIIMDLRDNAGGLLEQTLGLIDAFLEGGHAIVQVKERNEGMPKVYRTTNECLDCKSPLVILINGNSASGAEIVAGAMKDNGRAMLIGERTFGKGLMQKIFPLPSGGGAIKLTTAALFTPANAPIEDYGIEPDVSQDDLDGAQLNKARELVKYLIRVSA